MPMRQQLRIITLLIMACSSVVMKADSITVDFSPPDLVGAPGSTVYLDGTIFNETSQTAFITGWSIGSSSDLVQSAGLDAATSFFGPIGTVPGLAPGDSYS